MNKHIRIFLVVLCCYTTSFSYAQQYTVTAYKGESGLPNTFTKSVAFDTLGFVWIATDNYVTRFDGQAFTHYNQNLPTNYIKYMYCTREGDMMVLSDMGLSRARYTRDTVVFELLIKGGTNSDDSSNHFIVYPKMLMQDVKGRLWISENRAVSYYYKGSLQRFFFSPADQSNSFYRSFSLTQFADGTVIAVSERGNGFWFNEKEQKFVPITGFKPIETTTALLYIEGRRFLVANAQGLFSITLNANNAVEKYEQVVKNLDVASLVHENAQTYIVGTWTQGIYRISQRNEKYVVEKIETSFKSISNLYKQANGAIWSTADDGLYLLSPTIFTTNVPAVPQAYIQGARLVNGKMLMFRGPFIYQSTYNKGIFDVQDIWQNHEFKNILSVTAYNNMFVYTTGGREVIFTDFATTYHAIIVAASGSPNEPYYAVADKHGNIWVNQSLSGGIVKVTSDGKVIKYGADKGLFNEPITGVADKNGNYYGLASGDSSYILKYDQQNDVFVNVSLPLPFDHNADIKISDAVTADDGVLYLASSEGVLKYSEKSVERVDLGEYSRYGIRAVRVDKNGELWAATDAGLLHKTTNNVILFTERHGLASNSISWRGMDFDNNNQLWVATSAGVSFFPNVAPAKTPTPFFSYVSVNNSTIFDSLHVVNNSFAKLQYVCLAFPANNIEYQTRIMEKDTAWSASTHSNELIIPQMQTDTYTLQVRARQDGNYTWSTPAVYVFKVVPAWYQRWWAYMLYVLILALLVFVIVLWNTRRLTQQKQYLEQIVKERTAEIEQQKNTVLQQSQQLQQSYNAVEQQRKELENTLHTLQTTQKKLVEAEKMASLGNLVAGVAHEINTPVGVAITSISTVINDIKELVAKYEAENMSSSDFETFIQMFYDGNTLALKNLERTAQLVRSFKQISLDQHSEQERKFNLNDYLHDILASINPEFKHTQIKIAIDCPPDLVINSYPGAFAQIFTNLLTNSKRHGFRNRNEGQINIVVKRENDKLHMEYTDNGHGISEKVLPRIFDPFFTTDMQGGTGLGLHILYNLVTQKLGGEIKCESKEGEGVKFLMTL